VIQPSNTPGLPVTIETVFLGASSPAADRIALGGWRCGSQEEKLSSPRHHETLPWIPTPTAIQGKGDGNGSSPTASTLSSSTTGTLHCTKTSATAMGLKGRPPRRGEQDGVIQDHHEQIRTTNRKALPTSRRSL